MCTSHALEVGGYLLSVNTGQYTFTYVHDTLWAWDKGRVICFPTTLY